MSGEFPSNSKSSRPQGPANEEKKVESVVTSKVERRKKPLMKRIAEIFIGGDSKSVLQYVVMEVLVPQAKEMVTEAASQGFERMIYGESRPARRSYGHPRSSGPTNYSRYAVRGNNPLGRAGAPDGRPVGERRGQDVDDILLASRPEADLVLERLYDLLEKYGTVSVSDLYSLVGLSGSYVDQKWGWTELQGAQVRRVREGYIVELPRPVAID